MPEEVLFFTLKNALPIGNDAGNARKIQVTTFSAEGEQHGIQFVKPQDDVQLDLANGYSYVVSRPNENVVKLTPQDEVFPTAPADAPPPANPPAPDAEVDPVPPPAGAGDEEQPA